MHSMDICIGYLDICIWKYFEVPQDSTTVGYFKFMASQPTPNLPPAEIGPAIKILISGGGRWGGGLVD